tara:strand:+ start:520 stop:822 length:303 start_codon:yes stop_codon:yes gene_type:complete
MNLSNVETVDDLLALAAEPEETPQVEETETDNLQELVDVLDLDSTYTLALKLLCKLGNYHQAAVEVFKQEGELDRLVVWAQDDQKLHTAYDLVLEVVNNS